MSRIITTEKPSVLPWFAAGAVWLVLGFVLPLYRLSDEMDMEFATASLHNSFYFVQTGNIIHDREMAASQFEALVNELLASNSPKKWFRAYFNHGLINYIYGQKRLLPCDMSFDTFFIDPYGDVMPCNGTKEKLVMGNLNAQSWEELWCSPKAEEVRRQVRCCDRNCWMIGSVSPAMHKYIWVPAWWVIKHKFLTPGKKKYSMYENKIVRDYRDGRVTKEKYLNRCVESIVNQTYGNLEILLIDDGSPDRCPALCDAWAGKDGRIRVIHKQNEGLGMARNTGMENARGEDICFVDSDDAIAANTVEAAYALAQREDADVVIFGLTDVTSEGEVISHWIPKTEKQLYCGREVRETFLPDLISADPKTGKSANLFLSACVCLFSMELVKRAGWRFPSEREIISEDVYALLQLYRYVQKVAVLNAPLYRYHCSSGSLTRTYRPDRFRKVADLYDRCIALCRRAGYSAEVEGRCGERFLCDTITAMKQEAAAGTEAGLREIVNAECLQNLLREKRQDKAGLPRRLLFFAVRHRWYRLCRVLLNARNGAHWYRKKRL